MPSSKIWRNSFIAQKDDSWFVSLGRNIILNHMSNCDVFIRSLEYRVKEFDEEWEEGFIQVVDYIKKSPDLFKQLKCVDIKLGINCIPDQDKSEDHHNILKTLKKSIIHGESHARKDYEDNGIRLVISNRNCPEFLKWVRSYLMESAYLILHFWKNGWNQ